MTQETKQVPYMCSEQKNCAGAVPVQPVGHQNTAVLPDLPETRDKDCYQDGQRNEEGSQDHLRQRYHTRAQTMHTNGYGDREKTRQYTVYRASASDQVPNGHQERARPKDGYGHSSQDQMRPDRQDGHQADPRLQRC